MYLAQTVLELAGEGSGRIIDQFAALYAVFIAALHASVGLRCVVHRACGSYFFLFIIECVAQVDCISSVWLMCVLYRVCGSGVLCFERVAHVCYVSSVWPRCVMFRACGSGVYSSLAALTTLS